VKPTLQRSREQEILELSEDVASEDSQSGRVSPTRICAAKEIKLVHNNYGPGAFDGMLCFDGGVWVILCNIDNGNVVGSTRERFTVAHELGHFHIPEHRRQLMAGCPSHGSHTGLFDGADSIEELEADTFAANLLMPPTRFVPRLHALNEPPLQSITTLRVEFETSLESTAIQAMRHDNRVVAIAKWERDGLQWHRIANRFFRETGYRQFAFRQKRALPHDCATSLALGEPETSNAETIHESASTAAFCFGHVAAGGTRDVILREQAVRNGRFGVLAIYSVLEVSGNGHRTK